MRSSQMGKSVEKGPTHPWVVVVEVVGVGVLVVVVVVVEVVGAVVAVVVLVGAFAPQWFTASVRRQWLFKSTKRLA